MLLVTLPLALGFDRLIVRNVAASATAESWSLARGLIVRAVELVVPVTLGSIVIIGLAAVALQGSFAPGTVPVLLIALLTIPPTVLIIVRRALTLGLKRIVSSQLPENWSGPDCSRRSSPSPTSRPASSPRRRPWRSTWAR